ncbi:MAG: hypothetical protein KVP17_001958 [Porospora cf. gigantea B]|uniref:uncharacterized protein n=1 Tax=Porospora cf. gigantea B TaxID=2853592 RepID=UPI0035719A62|nr:MAG: hypothetical protein KVP17_001958 [Porospora cf. gigantea B]
MKVPWWSNLVVRPTWRHYCGQLLTRYEDFTSLSETLTNGFVTSRMIPPIHRDAASDLELVQVHTMVRHGARAPQHQYDGAAPKPIVWECALEPTPAEGTDHLHGSCVEGQLLVEGQVQGSILGRILAKAYFSEHNVLHDPTKAFDTQSDPGHNFSKVALFRSTRRSRAIMTGTAVMEPILKSFVNPKRRSIVPTIRKASREDMWINRALCPAVAEAAREHQTSVEMMAMVQSTRSVRQAVEKIMQPEAAEGHYWPSGFVDDLQTRLCSRKIEAVPPQLRPGHLRAARLLDRALLAGKAQSQHLFHWRSGRVSKIAMAHFLSDLKAAVLSAVLASGAEGAFWTRRQGAYPTGSPHRFFLYSGHDTTIMPLLAALGVWSPAEWPPYASIATLEFLRSGERFLFRIIYNGAAVTRRFKGCDTDLCALETFFLETDHFATPTQFKLICEGQDVVNSVLW